MQRLKIRYPAKNSPTSTSTDRRSQPCALRFSAHPFDRESFDEANARYRHDLHYFDARLSLATTVLGRGFPAVCAFVNDQLDVTVLMALAEGGTRMIALRSAGFNHVDVKAGQELG